MNNKTKNYNCHYYYEDNNKLIKVGNKACWYGFKGLKHEKDLNLYILPQVKLEENDFRILELINKITPCKLVTYKGKSYIKYKSICENDYRKNLVLLDFIRFIWHDQSRYINYEKFFNHINKKIKGKDSLKLLLEGIKVSSDIQMFDPGHSVAVRNLVPKTYKNLIKSEVVIRDTWLKSKK